jgi:hypothetical protein
MGFNRRKMEDQRRQVPAGTAITIRLLSSRSQPPRKIHWGRLVEIPAQAPLRLI